ASAVLPEEVVEATGLEQLLEVTPGIAHQRQVDDVSHVSSLLSRGSHDPSNSVTSGRAGAATAPCGRWRELARGLRSVLSRHSSRRCVERCEGVVVASRRWPRAADAQVNAGLRVSPRRHSLAMSASDLSRRPPVLATRPVTDGRTVPGTGQRPDEPAGPVTPVARAAGGGPC